MSATDLNIRLEDSLIIDFLARYRPAALSVSHCIAFFILKRLAPSKHFSHTEEAGRQIMHA